MINIGSNVCNIINNIMTEINVNNWRAGKDYHSIVETNRKMLFRIWTSAKINFVFTQHHFSLQQDFSICCDYMYLYFNIYLVWHFLSPIWQSKNICWGCSPKSWAFYEMMKLKHNINKLKTKQTNKMYWPRAHHMTCK